MAFQKIRQTLEMLTQAWHVIREEIPSLKRTKVITRISNMKHQKKAETSKRSINKVLAVDIDMVGFLPIHFLVGINQPNILLRDMFAKEVEWAKLSKEVTNNFVIMQFPWPSKDLT